MVYISLKYILLVHTNDQGASQVEKDASGQIYEKQIFLTDDSDVKWTTTTLIQHIQDKNNMPAYGLAPMDSGGIDINGVSIKIGDRDKSLSSLNIPFPTDGEPTDVRIWMLRIQLPNHNGRRHSIGGYRRVRKMRKSRRTKRKGRKSKRKSKRKGSRRKSRRTRRR